MEKQLTRFSHVQIKTIHDVLVNGNTTGLSFNQILQNSRLEITVVSSFLNRLLERRWIYGKNMHYRLTDNGNRVIKKMLDKKEDLFDLQILNS